MNGKNGFQDSMQPGNSYTFHCPTVDRDARFIVCGFKLTKNRKGEDFADHDCKAAMRGGKCPFVLMQQSEWRTGQRRFSSDSAEVRKLPDDIIQGIEKIILVPSQGRGLNLTPEQQTRLFGKVALAENPAAIPGEVANSPEPKRRSKPHPSAKTAKEAEANDLVSGAAGASADMAAILNKARDQK